MSQLIFFFLVLIYTGYSSLSPLSAQEKPAEWGRWTFDQKIAWRGTHLDPNISYGPLVDKLEVKKIIGNEILTARTLFATDKSESIVIDSLPRNYVMKANNASGRGLLIIDGIIVARKKRDEAFNPVLATITSLRSYAENWLKTPYSPHKEHQYLLMKPMIIFEEYLENLSLDIELFCFHGEVKLIELLFIENYKKQPTISFYDRDWNLLKAAHPHHKINNQKMDKPLWLETIIAFAEDFTTKENIDHVRIDFYLNGEDIYFGEFTFIVV